MPQVGLKMGHHLLIVESVPLKHIGKGTLPFWYHFFLNLMMSGNLSGISEPSVYLQVNTVQTTQAQTFLCYPGVVNYHKECGFVPCHRNFCDTIFTSWQFKGKKLLKDIGLGRVLSALVSVTVPRLTEMSFSMRSPLLGFWRVNDPLQS